jgi:hypothetical protein
MPVAVMVVALCFLGVVLFALHRRKYVNVSMSFLKVFGFTIAAQDAPPPPVSKTVGHAKR